MALFRCSGGSGGGGNLVFDKRISTSNVTNKVIDNLTVGKEYWIVFEYATASSSLDLSVSSITNATYETIVAPAGVKDAGSNYYVYSGVFKVTPSSTTITINFVARGDVPVFYVISK